jgi:hypothetical protein
VVAHDSSGVWMPIPLMPSAVDLRHSERMYCQASLRLRTSDGLEFPAMCTDITRTGVGVDCERVLAVGQRVELLVSDKRMVAMMVIYRMADHYGLSAVGACDALLEILPRH